MIKKVLKGFGVVFLCFIMLMILVAVWSYYKSSEYEETAVPYMETAIKDISTWDKEVIKSYLTPSVESTINDSDFEILVNSFTKMGALVEISEYQFNSVESKAVMGSESGTFVTYTIPTKYENGDATITLTLKEEGDSFSVYQFNLNSLTLLK